MNQIFYIFCILYVVICFINVGIVLDRISDYSVFYRGKQNEEFFAFFVWDFVFFPGVLVAFALILIGGILSKKVWILRK